MLFFDLFRVIVVVVVWLGFVVVFIWVGVEWLGCGDCFLVVGKFSWFFFVGWLSGWVGSGG